MSGARAPEVEGACRARWTRRRRRSTRPSPSQSGGRSPPRRARSRCSCPALGGSLPDYVFTKMLGIPAFGVPYANADEANHAPNENIEVERFFGGIELARRS